MFVMLAAIALCVLLFDCYAKNFHSALRFVFVYYVRQPYGVLWSIFSCDVRHPFGHYARTPACVAKGKREFGRAREKEKELLPSSLLPRA